MNTELVNEGNKLIFDFMGCIHSTNADIDLWEMNALKYHSSWNDLMPVLHKIQSVDITPAPNYKGYRIEIVLQGYVKITGFPMPQIFTNVSIEGSLIIAVWKTVIQFIKYQNETRNHF